MDLIGSVGVGLRETYGCRCSILYVPMLGVIFYVGLVSLTSSYPSPCSPLFFGIIVLGGGGGGFVLPPWICYVCVCVGIACLFSV